jgi:hypothetical protein
MPNGGHICCEYCTYNRQEPGLCDVFGVNTSPRLLCRSFRKPGQSHTESRKEWPIVENLRPGVVYEIDNEIISAGSLRPAYKIVSIAGVETD